MLIVSSTVFLFSFFNKPDYVALHVCVCVRVCVCVCVYKVYQAKIWHCFLVPMFFSKQKREELLPLQCGRGCAQHFTRLT